MLRAIDAGDTHWDTHLPKATWLVNTRGSANRAVPTHSKLVCTVEGDKVHVAYIKNILGKTVWVIHNLSHSKSIHGIAFAQGPGCTSWVMQKDVKFQYVPQGDLIWGENSPWTEFYGGNSCIGTPIQCCMPSLLYQWSYSKSHPNYWRRKLYGTKQNATVIGLDK